VCRTMYEEQGPEAVRRMQGLLALAKRQVRQWWMRPAPRHWRPAPPITTAL
jgi:hypothetical protein